MKVNVGGVSFEIINWDEVEAKLLDSMGAQVQKSVVDTIKELNLIDTSQFFQSIKFMRDDNGVVISSDVYYSYFLEYGTLEFGERFTSDSFPDLPVKKKILPSDLRKQFPRGMNPFAPFRRTIYNRRIMETFLNNAVKNALK
jgi:hypothetical protein